MRFIEIIAIGFLLGVVSIMWTSLSGIPLGTPDFTAHASTTFITLSAWTFILYCLLFD